MNENNEIIDFPTLLDSDIIVMDGKFRNVHDDDSEELSQYQLASYASNMLKELQDTGVINSSYKVSYSSEFKYYLITAVFITNQNEILEIERIFHTHEIEIG